MPTSRSGLMSVNSAGKLGARQTAVGAPESSSARTSAMEPITCFARWLQTLTQLPQLMQRWPMISAWPSEMRIAFAGHSRTQV